MRTCLLGVEILLESGQQIDLSGGGRRVGNTLFLGGGQPRVLQSFRSSRSLPWVDGQAASNEITSGFGYGAPVFCRLELVVAPDDGFHFLLLGVAVEGSVTAEEEVGNDAHGPDVDWFGVAGWWEKGREIGARQYGFGNGLIRLKSRDGNGRPPLGEENDKGDCAMEDSLFLKISGAM